MGRYWAVEFDYEASVASIRLAPADALKERMGWQRRRPVLAECDVVLRKLLRCKDARETHRDGTMQNCVHDNAQCGRATDRKLAGAAVVDVRRVLRTRWADSMHTAPHGVSRAMLLPVVVLRCDVVAARCYMLSAVVRCTPCVYSVQTRSHGRGPG